MESKTQDIGIFFGFFHTHTHALTHTHFSFIHVTFERQQMSVLQGNNVFVAKLDPDIPDNITPPSPGMNGK